MNGQSDFCDLLDGTSDDCNGTLIPDECDIAAGTSSDCQENTIPDECEPDCNANEVPDDCDITQDSSEDCNDNEVPDECDIASGTSEDCNEDGAPDECIGLEDDCNANGIPDECIELEDDCNGNAVPDACDITEGTSEDCTGDGIPDECDSDCNGNGVADSCDIDAGTSQDCNENDIPDECETDCNGNGVADSCDIDAGTSQDCNYNQVPDECDVANGTSHDCNENGVPDECIDFELDCNSNGTPDECEPDCNGNGIPDDCDVLPGLSWLLTKLSHDQAVITALVPDRFDFTDGETGTNIPDGGNDMYNFGNNLNTSLDYDIEYTDNTVVASDDQFGPGSEYFTAKYTGLFIMATSGIAIDHFELLGNTGAGGDGDVNGSIFSAVSAGQVFTIFVKRIFGAGDPSITHIIIVPGDGPGVSHNFSNWTGTDQHEVLGLEAVNSLYFLVVARQNGLYLENESVRSVAEAFLDTLVVDSSSDCNANQVPDECDIADGSSDDRNRNGIPDECEQLPCEGDANGDGLVDPLDSGFVLARFGCPVDSGDPDCDTADQNDDGVVDPLDVGFVLSRFGPCND